MHTTPKATGSNTSAGRPTGRPDSERALDFFAVRPDEKRSVLMFFSYAFLLLVAYYVLRTLREPLLLVGLSASAKTYASATAAVVLAFLVPIYGIAFRHAAKDQLVRWVTGCFLAMLFALYLAGRSGFEIGFLYYVWLAVFGVTLIAQFWAHTADVFDVDRGQRLFPVIMAGATLGGLAGPCVFRVLYEPLGPWSLMLVAAGLLALTLPLVAWTRNCAPQRSRDDATLVRPNVRRPLGGFSLVAHDRYLMLLALLVVLLNCVNTLGDYVLAELVVRDAEIRIAANASLDKGRLIGHFYAGFSFAVNAVTVLAQVFLVGRLFRWIGVHGALLVLPLIALIGYGLAVFLPIFSILRIVKVVENSANYSVMNTARQALYLPLSTAAKYEGKIATDTFFWRFGDVLPAGIVFAGSHWLGLGFQDFALFNIGFALAWLAVGVRLAQLHSARSDAARDKAPRRVAAAARWAAFASLAGRLLVSVTPRVAFVRGLGVWLSLAVGVAVLTRSAPVDAAFQGGSKLAAFTPKRLERIRKPAEAPPVMAVTSVFFFAHNENGRRTWVVASPDAFVVAELADSVAADPETWKLTTALAIGAPSGPPRRTTALKLNGKPPGCQKPPFVPVKVMLADAATANAWSMSRRP
jgi:AAA family ATP:ADP antiporter